MKNIIIIGQMGSGKDTVADYLNTEFGYTTAKLGAKIRKEVNSFSGTLGLQKERRKLYQRYGQAMRKLFGDDVWNEHLHEQIEPFMHFSPFVIADCRQQNEIDYWMAKGFVPLALHVEDEIRIPRIMLRDGAKPKKAQLNHETELFAMDLINKVKSGEIEGYWFDNSGTAENMSKLKELLADVLKD